MKKWGVVVCILLASIIANSVSAATIYGNVYDFSLEKVSNAWVEINTSPKQFLIARNGSYSFNVPNGDYTIKAQLMQKNTVVASITENITINQDGSYVLDLILFPDVGEGVEDPGIDVNGDVVDMIPSNNYYYWVFSILAGIILGAASYYWFKIKNKKKPESAENNDSKNADNSDSGDLEQVIKIIKQEGGRTTQKDIRKQIPLSEAKISLMIAELEHKGFVEKIKKGRGNIIILKKK